MRTKAVIIATLLATPLISSCRGTDRAQKPTQTKPARWVAQYRSPASQKYAGTTALARFSYNAISVVSPAAIFVAADVPNPKDPESQVAQLIRTTDGGQTWAEFEVPAISSLNAIHFISQSVGWVAGADPKGQGIVAKTTDGGQRWSTTKLEFKQIPTAIFFANDREGWLGGVAPIEGEEDQMGGPSDILATTDGGQSWFSQRRIPTSITDLFFLDQRRGWAVGYNGAIYQTTDGGIRWEQQKSELEPGDIPVFEGDRRYRFIISGVHFVDDQRGWAAARSGIEDIQVGRVLATTNGGRTWSRIWATDFRVRDVFFVSPSQGWAAAATSKYVYHTTDGGASWQVEPIDFEQDVSLYRIAGADPSHVWAVGAGAIFYRRAD
jgi:photosystem II stability/assembly factor-like uncharacterized protein